MRSSFKAPVVLVCGHEKLYINDGAMLNDAVSLLVQQRVLAVHPEAGASGDLRPAVDEAASLVLGSLVTNFSLVGKARVSLPTALRAASVRAGLSE